MQLKVEFKKNNNNNTGIGAIAILTTSAALLRPQPTTALGGNETVNLISTSWDGVENMVKGYI